MVPVTVRPLFALALYSYSAIIHLHITLRYAVSGIASVAADG